MSALTPHIRAFKTLATMVEREGRKGKDDTLLDLSRALNAAANAMDQHELEQLERLASQVLAEVRKGGK